MANPLADANKTTVHPGLVVLAQQALAVLTTKYRDALLAAIPQAIVANEITRVASLTSALASDLIGEGYDLRHLYWRGEYFLKVPARPFNSKLADLLGLFRHGADAQYRVGFRLVFGNPQGAEACPRAIGTLQIAPNVPGVSKPTGLDFAKHDPNFRYASCEIPARDPFAASRTGSAELSKALDLLQFTQPATTVTARAAALVVGANNTEMVVPTSMELLGPIRLGHDDLDTRLRQLTAIDKDGRIADPTKDRLTVGLQYLRRGIADNEPHGQFLNLWIGLEAVVGGVQRTDIADVRRFVSRLIAVGYSRRILVDLRANLQRSRSALGTPWHPRIIDEANRDLALASLWEALHDQAALAALRAAVASDPLLHHRLDDVAQMLESSESIRIAVERHAQDVSWHVQRMFRMRNAIVHSGYLPRDLTHVSSHLATYLWAIMRTLIDELAIPRGIPEIKAVFEKFSWLYEELVNRLKKAQGAAPVFAEVTRPTATWPTV